MQLPSRCVLCVLFLCKQENATAVDAKTWLLGGLLPKTAWRDVPDFKCRHNRNGLKCCCLAQQVKSRGDELNPWRCGESVVSINPHLCLATLSNCISAIVWSGQCCAFHNVIHLVRNRFEFHILSSQLHVVPSGCYSRVGVDLPNPCRRSRKSQMWLDCVRHSVGGHPLQ